MNGGALAHVGFPRPVQQVHIGRALGGTQTTRIIDLAGALVGSNPGLATTYTEQSSSGIEQPRRLNSRARNCLNLLLFTSSVIAGAAAS